MIKTFARKVFDLPLVAATTAMAAAAIPASAQNVGEVADTVTGQLSNIGQLIGGAAFLGGVFFVATGLFKLKQAVDTQGQQVKYGDGVWRLALGAALVALPAVIGVGTGTFGLDDTQTIDFGTTFSQ